MSTEPMRFVLQENYLSVIVNDRPVNLNASHPTFASMRRALERKQWERVPKLVSLAEKIASKASGSVKVQNGNVYYHGRVVNSALTTRIIALIKEGKSVGHMLKFMDNLFQNPSQDCIQELYDFLGRYKLPITDDGCFMAYKIVNSEYKDCHTGTFDNSVGRVLVMPRKDVDANRKNECSYGFHFCSLAYLAGFCGSYIMAIKINPKDVVSIPEMDAGKGRTWRYEVIGQLAEHNARSTSEDAPSFLTSVYPAERDRKAVLAKVLAHPHIKRAIRKRKLKAVNIRKHTIGRLQQMLAKLAVVEPVPQSKLIENPIFIARTQAGLTTSDVATELGLTAKEVIDAERFANVGQRKADEFIRAILAVQKKRSQAATA